MGASDVVGMSLWGYPWPFVHDVEAKVAVRPEFRWWILTLVVVAVLVLISLLAMDRPNVIWRQGEPSCPHCRSEVASFSSRCRTCREQYDWAAAPDEDSPLSRWSLSALEAKALVDRVLVLGDEVAATRVAEAIGVTRASATAYLKAVGRGRCGYCGGTEIALDVEPGGSAQPCPVCLGQGACIACNGDRRMRVGDEAAYRALKQYVEAVGELHDSIPAATRRSELKNLTEEFVRRYAGTVEATQVLFWPEPPTRIHPLEVATATPAIVLQEARRRSANDTAVGAARRRLDAVLEAVARE